MTHRTFGFQALTLLALIALPGSAVAQAARSLPRQVAAPASDILSGLVRLPDPSSTPTSSHAAVLPLRFEREVDGRWAATVELPVERDGALALGLLSPDAGSFDLLVGTAGGSPEPIESVFGTDRRVALASEELPGWVIARYDVRDARAGTWTVRVETDGSSGRVPEESWLFASAQRDLGIEAWVTTLHTVVGEPIGIVARAREDSQAARVDRAELVIERAGLGSARAVTRLTMLDDGAHEDGAAGDGAFGALVPAGVVGPVRARVEISGATRAGHAFLRTAQLAFTILDRRLFLDGAARASAPDDDHLAIEIGALPLGPAGQLHVSAEMWARDDAGRALPVCWLSRQLVPQARDGRWILPLVLDARWLALTNARAPLELRQVRVQDPDSEVVLDRADRVELGVRSLPAGASDPIEAIVPEMLTGGTSFLSNPVPQRSPHWNSPGLVLVHGYCSGGSPWPAADFTQPKLAFLDANQNRSHDQFAQLIDQQAQAASLGTFGIVAHSQGGCAALHLLTYYQSGLDFARGGRRIQSLATPYQGTPLASWGGFTCGVNNDMTPAGSATWLAGIPSWARAEVWYWTTQDGGSECNFFTGLILGDPNDGTIEVAGGQLPGANPMGNTAGWCHTTGMTYPAGYTDHPRNQAMNAAAAR